MNDIRAFLADTLGMMLAVVTAILLTIDGAIALAALGWLP